MRLPLDDFKLSEPEASRYQAAFGTLLERCLSLRGHGTRVLGEYIRPRGQLLWGGRLGTLSIDQANEYGYHASPTGSFSLGPGIYLRSLSNFSPESASALTETALYGSDESKGCFQEVDESFDEPLREATDLESDLVNLSLNDSRTRAAIKEWGACMNRMGFPFDDPRQPTERFLLQDLSPDEVRVAIADVQCTASSEWSRTFYAILSGYQEQAIVRFPNDLNQILQSQADRLRDAETLVSEDVEP